MQRYICIQSDKKQKFYDSSTTSCWVESLILSSIILFPAPNPYSLHGAPIIEPAGPHIVIEVEADKKIECKADKPVTWISEVWWQD